MVFADATRFEEPAVGAILANPKSSTLACPRLVTKNIRQLDVAMHDPLRMGWVQTVRNLRGQ